MADGQIGLLRYRVVITGPNGSEVTNDLPHPHGSTWTITSMQPGNPGSAALGSFTLPLFPPGSKEFYAAKAVYDKLDYFQRVEGYISPDGASLGKLKFAGIITGIEKVEGDSGDVYQLTGLTDLALANYSRPFPGELLSNAVTSDMIESYLGTNELGASDTFNPFTAANYNSVALPGAALGGSTWSGTTDDGFNVVTCSSGTTGAALISKTGAAANDRWNTHFVEATGRLNPSIGAGQNGQVGVGLCSANNSANDCVLGFVQSNQTARTLDAFISVYIGGVLTQVHNYTILSNIDDPQGMIPLTIGLLVTKGGQSTNTASASLTVNGKVVLANLSTSYDPGTSTRYPCLVYASSANGTAVPYLTNLVQMTRFTTDGASTAATFGEGTIGVATHSLAYGTDPGPTFLEAWSRLATREGWYWRYTPQAYVVGTRTLGTVDFAADPGTDRSTVCIFKQRLGNLASLRLSANADQFASGTAVSASSSPDGGGLGFWRDIATMTKYGVIEDQTLAMTAYDFNTARRFAYQITANKINLSSAGSKTAVVLRDAETADVWRELDKILIDHPDLGISNLVARVIGYTFTEGSPVQTVTLDQFSSGDPTLQAKRFQQSVFEVADAGKVLGAAGGAAASGQGIGVMSNAGYAAAGNQGGYSTANSSTWTDITNSSFTIAVNRPAFFLYMIYAAAHISAGAGTGYFRGNIVGFDVTASLWVNSSAVENGFLWYGPYIKGPIQPGTYTVKMQAATDAGTTITIDQFFHQFLLLGT